MPGEADDGAVRVRPLTRADVPALLGLIDALADYEHLSPPAMICPTTSSATPAPASRAASFRTRPSS